LLTAKNRPSLCSFRSAIFDLPDRREMLSKSSAELFGFWLLFACLVVVRYLGLVEFYLERFRDTTGDLANFSTPFNLTQFDAQRMINFTYLPASFAENCNLGSKHHLRLLVLVLSSVENFESRNSIRNLWADPAQSRGLREGKAKVYFLVGNGMNATEQLKTEIKKYDDIIVTDTPDNYMNLVYKVFTILHIAADLCPSSFVLKVDEDVVFNIDRFIAGIHTTFFPEKADVYCRVWHKMQPKRNATHKWYISVEQFAGDAYPNFCSGSSYVLTRQAARKLLNYTHLAHDIQVIVIIRRFHIFKISLDFLDK
ncbi:hypothetical protein PFISCL1PPCAC_27812, partial [Pristionchus fissidentatus]